MRILTIAFLLLLSACSRQAPQTDASVDKAIRDAVSRLSPSVMVDSIKPAPFAGFQEVAIGAQVLYISNDGARVIEGTVVDTMSKKNLTAPAVEKQIARMLHNVSPQDQLVYQAEGEKRGRVYVFTDPSCSYCQKLHLDLPAIRKAGVEVVYLGYPRDGLRGQSYLELTSAFCSSDPMAAMDQVFRSRAVADAKASCLSPVDIHYQLAQRLGVRGTPAIYTEDGRHIGGYLPVDQIVQAFQPAVQSQS